VLIYNCTLFYLLYLLLALYFYEIIFRNIFSIDQKEIIIVYIRTSHCSIIALHRLFIDN